MVWLVSGLLVSFKNDFNLKLENVTPKERFDDLKLREKYGFDLGWYTLWDRIQVILKCVDGGETQIYLTENKIEVEQILTELIANAVDDFGVTEQDQKEIFKTLTKHGCCYF